MITIASSLFDCKRAPANPAFRSFSKMLNPTNQQQPLNTTDFRISRNYPHPTVGRPGGRPTPSIRSTDPTESWLLLVGRPGGRPSSNLSTLCTSVDRVPDTAGGRPDRSTDHLHLLLFCCCAAASSFVLLSSTSLVFTRRPSTILFDFLSNNPLSFQQFSTSAKIFPKI